MKNLSIKVLFLLCGAIIFGSCASQKNVTYLQGVPDGYTIGELENYEISIQPDDLLSIYVNSKDPELVMMFNLPLVTYQLGMTTSLSQRTQGYLVNKQGYIDFPQLGEIKAVGMTRNELTDHIKKELIDKGYVLDPVVTVQFLNFKVSVLGEVVRPGVIDVQSERISIFDAISAAGDLTVYGQRENIKVIREEKGVKTIALLDLRSASIMNSPYYYLQQNDVIYIEPNKAKAGQREINQNRTIATYASITSVLLSAVSIILSAIK